MLSTNSLPLIFLVCLGLSLVTYFSLLALFTDARERRLAREEGKAVKGNRLRTLALLACMGLAGFCSGLIVSGAMSTPVPAQESGQKVRIEQHDLALSYNMIKRVCPARAVDRAQERVARAERLLGTVPATELARTTVDNCLKAATPRPSSAIVK